jgi:hypothetical protein
MHIASTWSFQQILETLGELPLCTVNLGEIKDTNFGIFSGAFDINGRVPGFVVVTLTRFSHMMSIMALMIGQTHRCITFGYALRIVGLLILVSLALNTHGQISRARRPMCGSVLIGLLQMGLFLLVLTTAVLKI